MSVAEELNFDHALILSIASRSLGESIDEVADLMVVPVRYEVFNPVSAGLFEVSGSARASGKSIHWTVMLKICRRVSSDELASVPVEMRDSYVEMLRWDREANAYSSGLLDTLPAGLEAPRLLHIERQDGAIWIWLERVREVEARWTMAGYARAARHLGRFNGEYLAGRPMPRFEWLSRNWIHRWSDFWNRSTIEILNDDRPWSQPLVVELFPWTARDDLRRLALDYEERWAVLERLPKTLSHIDAFRANLLSRRDATVAVDWAFVGIAPFAAEAAQLVVASLFYSGEKLDPDELAAATLSGYAEGLKDAGYVFDEGELERAYAMNAIARWGLTIRALAAVGDPDREEAFARARGIPFLDCLTLLAGRTRYLCALAKKLHMTS